MSKSSRCSAGTENITLSGSIQPPRVGRERDASRLQRQSSRDKREVTEMWLLLADCCSIKWSEKWDGAERDRKTRPGRPTSCTHIHISVSDIWIKVSGKLWSWSLRRRCCFYASAAVTAVDRAGVFLGHLSVSTSSRGNFFKYATNIRLDSVMFLQKTFWSLLRTRRNRGWYCSGETYRRFQTVLIVEISESNGPKPVICGDGWMRKNNILSQRLREKAKLGLRLTIICIIDGVCNSDGVQEK